MNRIISIFKKLSNDDVFVRAFKTFVQAFVAVWLVAEQPFSTEVISSAVAAAVSAVWNTWIKK